MNEEHYWQAVLDRDADYEGDFVYAVKSTGIYCKPTCPSRRPNREQVRFFAEGGTAEAAGFRPCKRCRPDVVQPTDAHVEWVAEACHLLEQEENLSLEALAEHFHYSPFYVQKTFKRIVGVSPRQYAEEQRLQRFKQELQAGADIAEAVYAVGYSGSSAVYHNNRARLGMTPKEYQTGGRGTVLAYIVVPCTLGYLLVAGTERGVASVCIGDSSAALIGDLAQEFPEAALVRDDNTLKEWVETITAHLAGTQPALELPLDVQATAFQRRVWEALRTIPYGEIRSYSEVAQMIGQPSSVRAVARACATNPTALVTPCHRVVRNDGTLGGYRWGSERKQKLLETERRVGSGA